MCEMSNDPECIFSFWVGMPYATQLRILQITSRSSTVTHITVFRDRKWSRPVEGTFENICFSSYFVSKILFCSVGQAQ